MLYSELCSADVRLARANFRQVLQDFQAASPTSPQTLTVKKDSPPMYEPEFTKHNARYARLAFQELITALPEPIKQNLLSDAAHVIAFLTVAEQHAPDPATLPQDR